MKLKYFLLILIVGLALFLRFYKLGEIPAGIHPDEESHGYNAFSLLHTGKDRYGEPHPILFRSFGSYQPPVYTYLAMVPVGLFGNTIASVRSVSAVVGIILVIITCLFVLELFETKEKHWLALIAALIVAISPWSIYFSRLVAEGNLGVTFFALSLLLFIVSTKKAWVFPFATLALGISTHAYYSERIIAMLFLPIFIYLFWDHLWNKNKKWLLIGLSVFVTVMLPHLLILTSGALTRRLAQVGYSGDKPFITEFLKRYLIYFDPRNIFFDLGSDLGRMPPNLGVFYTIFIIPFFVGLVNLKKFIKREFVYLFVALVTILPIAAALTGDEYYPLRSLSLIWVIGLIISVGSFVILSSLNKNLRLIVFGIVLFHALFSFYISYFVLFKYETAKDYGNVYMALANRLEEYKGYIIVIDSGREYGAGLRAAYLTKYDPNDLQEQLKSQLTTPYYSGDVEKWEDYSINNMEFRHIIWKDDVYKNQIIVGDDSATSDHEVIEHKLRFLFEVTDINGGSRLRAFLTDPKAKCGRNNLAPMCKDVIY